MPESAPVEMAAGQLLAELGPVGKVGRQLLEDAQGRIPVRLRFLGPARITPDHAPVGVAVGQRLTELGSGGEVGRQSLPDTKGLVVVLLRLPEVTQPVTNRADPEAYLRPHRPPVAAGPP